VRASLLLLLPHSALAATLNVGPGQTYGSIEEAVDDARDGDILAIQPGSYEEYVEIDDKDLTLTALGLVEWTGAEETLLRIEDAEVAILGITFRPSGGRALRIENAEVSLDNSEVSGNTTNDQPYNGAAIAVYFGSTLSIGNSVFADNRTEPDFFEQVSNGYGGHIYVLDSDLIIDGSTFRDGEAEIGGAIFHGGTGLTSIFDSTFLSHRANDRGGVLYVDDESSLVVERTQFLDNEAAEHGGVLRWSGQDPNAAVVFSECLFQDNEAGDYGGAIAVNVGGVLQIRDSDFTGNTARAGGAISVYAVEGLSLQRNGFCNNSADDEAGAARIYEVDGAVLTNNIFLHNSAGGRGGSVYLLSGSHTLTNNDILDGSAAPNSGGGVWSEGADLVARNNLIGWTRRGSGMEGTEAPDEDWSDLWSNQPRDLNNRWTRGAGSLTVDPLLLRYTPDELCDDDLRLRAGSPLIDAGDPTIFDPDGSRSDIGAYGGPDAPASLWEDNDRDGSVAAYDCADDDPTILPGATERCDGLDNDCDGEIDSPAVPGAPTWYPDRDGDGFGNDQSPIQACSQPPNTVDLGGDCDDRDAEVLPGADEVCDGRDNNCDGSTDGPDAIDQLTWFSDADEDGFGTPSSSIGSCQPVPGYALSDADCDDQDAEISPAAEERCDDVDNNCDGRTDGDDAVDRRTWYADADADGWGAPGPAERLDCDDPGDGFSRSDADCNDADPEVHPFAEESCTDPADRNCDGSTGAQDLDADGFIACEDCDDQDAAAYPGANDPWYDGVLRDCNRTSDFDADLDGYESNTFGGDDCDDQDAGVNPGATERADDTIDNNCDGIAATDPYLKEDLRAGCAGCATQGPTGAQAGLLLLLVGLRRRIAPAARTRNG
jgi:hypothetical protein